MRTLGFTALIFWGALASGQGSEPVHEADEIWSCWERYDTTRKELVSLTVYRDMGMGVVVVAGGTQGAQFKLEGFNRRWDFGDAKENGALPFAFIIEPDGAGAYYDFTLEESAVASQHYQCREV